MTEIRDSFPCAEGDRNPILLIHGIWDRQEIFNTMSTYLSEQGWSVYRFNLIPNDGSAKMEVLAQQVCNYITEKFPPEKPLDLVGFSMGGLVSRYYVQRLGGIERVQRFVTISSPHQGTYTAYATGLDGYVQMRPKSDFLQDLDRDVQMLERINFTSIWTPLDAIIIPASSSQMPMGEEVKINVLFHPLMVSDPQSLNAIRNALLAPLKIQDQKKGFSN
jgi:triacylglycerol lipase